MSSRKHAAAAAAAAAVVSDSISWRQMRVCYAHPALCSSLLFRHDQVVLWPMMMQHL
jgi:hypothetical protein